MSTPITVGQLADAIGTNPEALRKRLSRNYADNYPGQSWGVSAIVPDAIAAELLDKSGKRPARKKSVSGTIVRIVERPAPVVVPDNPPQETADTSEPVNVRGLALSALLIGIVLGHAGLVWYDCASLWGTPGGIAGGLVFAVVLAAVMISTMPTKGYTQEACIWFVALCDIAAGFVHYPVFSEYGVENTTTVSLCIFVCATSFAALYIFKSYKNEL